MKGNRQQLKEAAAAAVEAWRPRLEKLCRLIHAHPEIGYKESRASAWLTEFLAERGFEVQTSVAGMATAFRATFSRGRGQPRVAYLAEYDALPELGHACGHNLVGVASAGAAAALARAMEEGEVDGGVWVLGCPAEEGAVEGAGAKVVMVQQGVFAGVDAALMFHPAAYTAVATATTAREALEFSFKGKAAHAAGAAWEGVNALEAAIQTFNGVNALRQHLPDGVKVHGIITRGGVAPSIVPEYAEVRLYVRAPDQHILAQAVEKVKACARGAALATGAQVSVRPFANPYQALLPNPPLARAILDNLRALGLTPEDPGTTGSGSTDVGNVSRVVPVVHAYAQLTPGCVPHTPEFMAAAGSARGLRVMLLAAKALAMTGVELLVDPELLGQVRHAFEARNP